LVLACMVPGIGRTTLITTKYNEGKYSICVW